MSRRNRQPPRRANLASSAMPKCLPTSDLTFAIFYHARAADFRDYFAEKCFVRRHTDL
jgi:hypothetical protein